MADIDPQISEKAGKAIGTTSRLAATVMFSDTADELTKAELRALYVEAARVALEAVADDLRAEGAAKALREAADALEMHSDRDNPVPDDPRWTSDLGYYGEAAWLRDRADAVEAGRP